MPTEYLTKAARKRIARQAASEVYKKPTNYQVGQAGKIIDEIVEADPKMYIDFSNTKYCTPKHEAIIEATVERLKPQTELF